MKMPMHSLDKLIVDTCAKHRIDVYNVISLLLDQRAAGIRTPASERSVQHEVDEWHDRATRIDETSQMPTSVLGHLTQCARAELERTKAGHVEFHPSINPFPTDAKGEKSLAFSKEWNRRKLATAEALAFILQEWLRICESHENEFDLTYRRTSERPPADEDGTE